MQFCSLVHVSRMRLLHTTSLKLHEFDGGDDVPHYATLSHCWDVEEVTFSAYKDGTGPTLRGWQKIHGACRIAANNGLDYIWIDTCCIDKSSSAELSEAINSMFAFLSGLPDLLRCATGRIGHARR